MSELVRNAQPKPIKGAHLLDRRETRRKRVAAEQKHMQDALRRDSRKCRLVPKCEYAKRDLPIDPCHQQHRGHGGNPKGDRTTRQTVIAGCRIHHGMWDRNEIDAQPMTDRGFDGVVAYYKRNETGEMEHFATEQYIGVEETRGA